MYVAFAYFAWDGKNVKEEKCSLVALPHFDSGGSATYFGGSATNFDNGYVPI